VPRGGVVGAGTRGKLLTGGVHRTTNANATRVGAQVRLVSGTHAQREEGTAGERRCHQHADPTVQREGEGESACKCELALTRGTHLLGRAGSRAAGWAELD
jgi:hypothetical protein